MEDELPFALRDEEGTPEGVTDESVAPDGEPSGDPTAQGELEQRVEDEGWFIPKSNARQAFEQLLQSDPELRNRWNSDVGRKAKTQAQRVAARDYEPRIQELEAELEEARRRYNQTVIASTPQEEILERLNTDPNFRKAYISTQEEPQARPQVDRTQRDISFAIDTALDRAEESGMSPERIEQYREAIRLGRFDRDASGSPVSTMEALSQFQFALAREVTQLTSQKSAPKPKAEAKQVEQPKGNPNLRGGPDTSQSGSGAGTSGGYSSEEIKKMTPDQLFKTFGYDPEGPDFTDMAKSGKVKGWEF